MTKATKSVGNNSLIDGIVTDLIETSRRPSSKAICRYVQSIEPETVIERIGTAFVHALEARELKSDFAGGFKPEPVMGMIQEIANSLVYRALNLRTANESQANREKLGGSNGQSNYNNLCDAYGIEPIDTKHIADLVANDLESLAEIHSIMRAECSYMMIEPLYLFSTDQPDPENPEGDWIAKDRIESDLALAIDAIHQNRLASAERKRTTLLDKFKKAA